MLRRWKSFRLSLRPSRKPRQTDRARLHVEALEARTLLSLAGWDTLWAEPARVFASPSPTGYTPAQVRQAYGFDRIRFADGTVQGDGAGQTIAIVTAYHHPTIEDDLRTFNRTFGLPEVPRFTQVNQFGRTQFARFDSQWALETALDVQWAHAIAPGANILLVEANSARVSDLLLAVDYARQQPGVVTVSMSWGTNEFAGQSLLNRWFTTPAGHVDGAGLPGGITFVAASGDHGRPSWPATSPNVLAVGGSQLTLAETGHYAGEVGWRDSGGGVSKFEARPDYQAGLAPSSGRAVPDVSYGADPAAGFAVYATLPGMGQGWFQVGGTSAGAPQWAGLVAIAAQGRNLEGLPALADGPGAVYDLSDEAFHDITSGANSHLAEKGYDLVTGRGSPRADRVVAGFLGSADRGAPAGPAAVGVTAAEDQNDPPPAVDVGNLALILQTLSELPINSGNSGSMAMIPVTPQRLRDLPPPVQPPVLLPPPPSFSVIHYKVGGGDIVVHEEELGDRPPSKPMPKEGGPQAAVDGGAAVAAADRLTEPVAPVREQVVPVGGEEEVAAAGEGPAEQGNGLFRWVAASGLGLLLCGLWGSRAAQRRWRDRPTAQSAILS